MMLLLAGQSALCSGFACTISLVTRHTHCTSTVMVFKKVNNKKEKNSPTIQSSQMRLKSGKMQDQIAIVFGGYFFSSLIFMYLVVCFYSYSTYYYFLTSNGSKRHNYFFLPGENMDWDSKQENFGVLFMLASANLLYLGDYDCRQSFFKSCKHKSLSFETVNVTDPCQVGTALPDCRTTLTFLLRVSANLKSNTNSETNDSTMIHWKFLVHCLRLPGTTVCWKGTQPQVSRKQGATSPGNQPSSVSTTARTTQMVHLGGGVVDLRR